MLPAGSQILGSINLEQLIAEHKEDYQSLFNTTTALIKELLAHQSDPAFDTFLLDALITLQVFAAKQIKNKKFNENDYICILCNKNPPIENSHIIPQVMYKHHTDCERVPYLFQGNTVQSYSSQQFGAPLLCKTCEKHFSLYEGQLDEILNRIDLKDEPLAKMKYNWKLYMLPISISFRRCFILYEPMNINTFQTDYPFPAACKKVLRWCVDHVDDFKEENPQFTLDMCPGIEDLSVSYSFTEKSRQNDAIYTIVGPLKQKDANVGTFSITHSKAISFVIAFPQSAHYLTYIDSRWNGLTELKKQGWQFTETAVMCTSPLILFDGMQVIESQRGELKKPVEKSFNKFLEKAKKDAELKVSPAVEQYFTITPTKVTCKKEYDFSWKSPAMPAVAQVDTSISYWRSCCINGDDYIFLNFYDHHGKTIIMKLFKMFKNRLVKDDGYGFVEWGEIDFFLGLREYLEEVFKIVVGVKKPQISPKLGENEVLAKTYFHQKEFYYLMELSFKLKNYQTFAYFNSLSVLLSSPDVQTIATNHIQYKILRTQNAVGDVLDKIDDFTKEIDPEDRDLAILQLGDCIAKLKNINALAKKFKDNTFEGKIIKQLEKIYSTICTKCNYKEDYKLLLYYAEEGLKQCPTSSMLKLFKEKARSKLQ